METRQDKFTRQQLFEDCTDLGLREQLFSYMADELDDRAAEAVEQHLLDCRDCREFFLILLSIRNEVHGGKNLRGGGSGGERNEARVQALADFRDEGSEENPPALRAKSARGPAK